MKITDFGDMVFRNLDCPSDISISNICAWARFDINIGQLNNLLGTTYKIDSNSLEIIDINGIEICSGEAAVYQKIFEINYWMRQIKKSVGVGGVDIVSNVESDNGKVTFINRNMLALTYVKLKQDAVKELDKLVNYYKFKKGRATQVTGDDESVVATSLRLNYPAIIDGFGNSRGGY